MYGCTINWNILIIVTLQYPISRSCIFFWQKVYNENRNICVKWSQYDFVSLHLSNKHVCFARLVSLKLYDDVFFLFSLQNGLNALHLAAKEGHKDLVEELLERGAPVDSSTKVHINVSQVVMLSDFPDMNTVCSLTLNRGNIRGIKREEGRREDSDSRVTEWWKEKAGDESGISCKILCKSLLLSWTMKLDSQGVEVDERVI